MIDTIATSTTIRPHIAKRIIGGKLCLINQTRGEAWVCQGSSRQIWEKLQQEHTVPEIAHELATRYGVPVEKTLNDTQRFVDDLWKRQILDVRGREHVTNDEREAMVPEVPHNRKESGRLFALANDANVIYVAWLDLLIPCNLRCRHCYLDFSKTDILPLPKVLNILDQLADHGTVELILTGGEIFLRKDLIDIVAYAESKGFLFDLYTNANFINEEMADKLAKFAIHKMQISVYGTTAAIHEGITKKPGTFDKSVKAARMLIERGIRVRLQCHIQHDNFEDAFKFPGFAKSMGAEHRFDTKLVPNRNGSNEPLNYGVTLSQQAELYKAGLVDRLNPDSLCTAASSKARINSAGDVYPCDLISNVVVGNLYQNTLAEIWSSKWRAELRQQILGYKPNRCGGCGHSTDCTRCAALRGFNQEGHMEAPVSEACLLTTANLMSRGKEIAPNSPAGAASEGGCIDHLLSQNAGAMLRRSLINISLK
jgi:radical SAM protein with 4Fe4S-binding SPASM domain